jgi:hypothetical protein
MSFFRWILRRMRHVLDNIVEKIETHILYSVTFFQKSRRLRDRAVYEIMYKNIVDPERLQAIWRLRVAYWINEATRAQPHARARASTTPPPTHTHTRTEKYVILTAFPRHTVVTWTRLTNKLNVHCVSGWRHEGNRMTVEGSTSPVTFL